MLLWVMGLGFDNTCAVLGKWNISWVIPRLYGWGYKTLRLSPLVVEHSVVVMGARLNPMANYRFPFYEICVKNQWAIKFWDSVVRVQLPLGWRTYFLFNTDIVNFVWKSDEGETEGIVLLILVFWRCLNRQWIRVVSRGRKSYLGAAEIASFSSRDFSRSSKYGTFWLVTTGYFYVLFLWTIAASDFCLLEIYKNFFLAFSCQLSLLQSTATQITISINIFIYFKYYAVWNQVFLLKYTLSLDQVFLYSNLI